MKGNKGAIHFVKGQAGRSALLKLSGGNSEMFSSIQQWNNKDIVHEYKLSFIEDLFGVEFGLLAYLPTFKN